MKQFEHIKIITRHLSKNETKFEKMFWEIVRSRRFEGKKFYRQYKFSYDDKGKKRYFIFDFYCHERKLIVEIDGLVHDSIKEADKTRDMIVSIYGLKVLRIKNEEFNAIDNIKQRLSETLSPLSF